MVVLLIGVCLVLVDLISTSPPAAVDENGNTGTSQSPSTERMHLNLDLESVSITRGVERAIGHNPDAGLNR